MLIMVSNKEGRAYSKRRRARQVLITTLSLVMLAPLSTGANAADHIQPTYSAEVEEWLGRTERLQEHQLRLLMDEVPDQFSQVADYFGLIRAGINLLQDEPAAGAAVDPLLQRLIEDTRDCILCQRPPRDQLSGALTELQNLRDQLQWVRDKLGPIWTNPPVSPTGPSDLPGAGAPNPPPLDPMAPPAIQGAPEPDAAPSPGTDAAAHFQPTYAAEVVAWLGRTELWLAHQMSLRVAQVPPHFPEVIDYFVLIRAGITLLQDEPAAGAAIDPRLQRLLEATRNFLLFQSAPRDQLSFALTELQNLRDQLQGVRGNLGPLLPNPPVPPVAPTGPADLPGAGAPNPPPLDPTAPPAIQGAPEPAAAPIPVMTSEQWGGAVQSWKAQVKGLIDRQSAQDRSGRHWTRDQLPYYLDLLLLGRQVLEQRPPNEGPELMVTLLWEVHDVTVEFLEYMVATPPERVSAWEAFRVATANFPPDCRPTANRGTVAPANPSPAPPPSGQTAQLRGSIRKWLDEYTSKSSGDGTEMTRNALLGFLSTGLRLLENVAYDCAGYFDLLLDWVSTLQSQIELLDCFMLSECPSSPDTGHPTFFSAPIKAFLLQRGLDPATLSTAGYQVVSDGAKALLLLLTVRCVNWIYYLLPSNPTALLTDGLGLIKQNDLPPSVLIPVALRLHDFVDNFEFPSCMSHLPPEFATLPNDLAQARESRRLLLNHLQTPLSPTDYQASLAKMTTPLDAQPGPHVSDLSTAVSESDTAARSFSETYGDVAGAPPPDLNMGAPPSHPVDSDPEADRGPGEPSGDPAVGAPRPDAEMIDPDNPDGEDDEHEAPSVGFDGEAIVDPVVPTSPLETQMRPLLVPLYEGLDLLEQLVSSNTADLDLIADVSTNIYEGLHPIRQSLHAIRATDPESFARLDDELTALHDKRQRVMCLFAANFFPTAFALANRSKQRIEIMLSLPRINPFSFDPQVRMLCIALRVAEMDVSYSRLPPELRNLRDALYDILQQFPTILSDIKRRLPPDHYANLHRSLVAVPFPLHGDTVEEEETEELPGTGLQGWITSSQSPPASFLPGSRGESFPAPGAGGEPRGPLAIMPLALLNNHALFRDVRLEDRVFKVETTVIRRRDDVRLLGLPPLSDQSLERGIRRMFDTDTRELSHLIVGTQLVEVRRIPQAPTRR